MPCPTLAWACGVPREIGSLAGVWILWLFPAIHSGAAPSAIVPYVFFTGAVVMGLLGLAMDKLRCSVPAFLVLWILSTAGLVLNGLSQFESYERAMAKNGSFEAYLLPALNLSLLAMAIVLILCTGAWRGVQFLRGKSRSMASAS